MKLFNFPKNFIIDERIISMIEKREKDSGHNALVSFVNNSMDNEKDAIIICVATTHEQSISIEYIAYKKDNPAINKTRYAGEVLSSEQAIKLFKSIKNAKTTEQLEKKEKKLGNSIKKKH